MAVRAALGHPCCVSPGERLPCPPHRQLCSGVSPGAGRKYIVLMFLPEIVLMAPGVPLAVAWSLAGRASYYCVLPVGLVLAPAAVVDVLLG